MTMTYDFEYYNNTTILKPLDIWGGQGPWNWSAGIFIGHNSGNT
jgi:hypothetical protein